jgi:hypothetical protein
LATFNPISPDLLDAELFIRETAAKHARVEQIGGRFACFLGGKEVDSFQNQQNAALWQKIHSEAVARITRDTLVLLGYML